MSKKIKIGIIGVKGLPGYGGSARANEAILRRLASEFDLTLYALDSHASQSNFSGIKQHIFKSNNNKKINSLLYFIKSTLHAIFFGKYDFIHLNHGVSGFILPLLRLRYQSITTIRGLNFKQDDKWNRLEYLILKLSELSAFRLSKIVTTVEKSSINYIQRKARKKVVYIPNGVDRLFAIYESVVQPDTITFSAARIINLKGLHDLILALKILNYNGKLVVIGDMDQVPAYKKRIINLSTGLNVEFKGLLSDKSELFHAIASTRIFVFPSHSEGMSNMLLEAAALKRVIIASNIQQNQDIFTDDEVFFYSKGNPHSLADMITYVLNSQDLAEKKAQKAYLKVLREYNWDHISNQYRDVYRKMATSKM